MALTELEHTANEEARHGNREALEAAQARIAELDAESEGAHWIIVEQKGDIAALKAERDAAWNAALEAAEQAAAKALHPQDMKRVSHAIRALMKKEGKMDWSQLEKADRADLEALALAGRELAEAVDAMLRHSGVADAGPDMKDPDDHAAESRARAALARWKEAGGDDE